MSNLISFKIKNEGEVTIDKSNIGSISKNKNDSVFMYEKNRSEDECWHLDEEYDTAIKVWAGEL